MQTPGPDHPITLEPARRRWRALYNGHVIADSDDAIIVREADLAPVVYFPRESVGMEYMGRTERSTHCPYKGDAAYYTLRMDSGVLENVAWSYEDPFPAMGELRNRIAFYPGEVEVYELEDSPIKREVARDEIDEVVKHTDSGSGQSQRDHWEPNVETPGPEAGLS